MPNWMKTWFGDPTQQLPAAPSIYAHQMGGNIAGIGLAQSTVTSHTHNVPGTWQAMGGTVSSVMPIKRYLGIYGAVIEMVREIAEAGGGGINFEEDDIELDLAIYREGKSAVISFASIVDMVTSDRIEDMARYIEVTLAMLPPASTIGVSDVQNMYAQHLAPIAQQQYSNGWVNPASIFGSGI